MIGFIIVVFFVIFLIGVFTSTQSAVNRAIYGDEPTSINVYIEEPSRVSYEEEGILYNQYGQEVDEDGERV